jgi:hypothetical protein
MKVLIMQFPPISRHFIPPRFKYSPQRPQCHVEDVKANLHGTSQTSGTHSGGFTPLPRYPLDKRLDGPIHHPAAVGKGQSLFDLRSLQW